MKFLESIYPKGTFTGQKTDGAYINEELARNLEVYAKRIADDMHFLIIISGNDSVGNGKSTLATHIGAYLTNRINQLHGVNNTFTSKNVALKATKLVEQSFENPRLSVNVLDEGDDLTTHGMRQSAVELKRYFRKCRQLNQILILIIPSFFELPKFYALSRSHSLINVKFHSDFRRGTFDFYGPKQKKNLYLKGKRDWNYAATHPDFNGGFFSSYTFFPNLQQEIDLYKKKKYEDMVEDAEGENQKAFVDTRGIEKEIRAKLFYQIYTYYKGKGKYTIPELSNAFGINSRTGDEYLATIRKQKLENQKCDFVVPQLNSNKTIEEKPNLQGTEPLPTKFEG